MVENEPEVNKLKHTNDNSSIVNLEKVDKSKLVHDLQKVAVTRLVAIEHGLPQLEVLKH